MFYVISRVVSIIASSPSTPPHTLLPPWRTHPNITSAAAVLSHQALYHIISVPARSPSSHIISSLPPRRSTLSHTHMTLRNTSGKFSLSNFGRKASGAPAHDGPSSSDRTNGHYSDDPGSPVREGGSGFLGGGGNGNSNGGGGFDGLGKKLGKSIAHQSLLPGLGNKEQRILQE